MQPQQTGGRKVFMVLLVIVLAGIVFYIATREKRGNSGLTREEEAAVFEAIRTQGEPAIELSNEQKAAAFENARSSGEPAIELSSEQKAAAFEEARKSN